MLRVILFLFSVTLFGTPAVDQASRELALRLIDGLSNDKESIRVNSELTLAKHLGDKTKQYTTFVVLQGESENKLRSDEIRHTLKILLEPTKISYTSVAETLQERIEKFLSDTSFPVVADFSLWFHVNRGLSVAAKQNLDSINQSLAALLKDKRYQCQGTCTIHQEQNGSFGGSFVVKLVRGDFRVKLELPETLWLYPPDHIFTVNMNQVLTNYQLAPFGGNAPEFKLPLSGTEIVSRHASPVTPYYTVKIPNRWSSIVTYLKNDLHMPKDDETELNVFAKDRALASEEFSSRSDVSRTLVPDGSLKPLMDNEPAED